MTQLRMPEAVIRFQQQISKLNRIIDNLTYPIDALSASKVI